MEIRIYIILFLGVIFNSSIATYTNEENIDSSKTLYGAVNSILSESEASHTQNRHTYDNPANVRPYGNMQPNYLNGPSKVGAAPNVLCSAGTGCPLPPRRSNEFSDFGHNIDEPRSHTVDTDNPVHNGVGQIDVPSDPNFAGRGPNYPRYLPLYPQPYSPSQGYYPPGQVDPGFARFPPPQQGGPMPNYFPPPQRSYPPPVQWPYGPPTSVDPHANEPQRPHHHHHHHRDHDHHHEHQDNEHEHGHHHYPDSRGFNNLDYSLKGNTEYTEVGHRENTFQGSNNGLGYGSGYDGAFNRPGY